MDEILSCTLSLLPPDSLVVTISLHLQLLPMVPPAPIWFSLESENTTSYPCPFSHKPYGVHSFSLLLVSKCLSIAHLSLDLAHTSLCGCFIKVSIAMDSVSCSDPELSCCLLLTLLLCTLYLLLFLLISQIIRPGTVAKVIAYGVSYWHTLLAHPGSD